MITYRPFLNTDPPALLQLWRESLVAHPRVIVPTNSMFEQLVLGKLYFEHESLIVAERDDQLVGAVLAGFGATDDLSAVDDARGVISWVMVHPEHRRQGIARDLIARAETYLARRGATDVTVGGERNTDPYLLGVIEASELCGIFDSLPTGQALFKSLGYVAGARHHLVQRNIDGFRPKFERTRQQIQRRTTIDMLVDPPTDSWWEASTYGSFERMMFILRRKMDRERLGQATAWLIRGNEYPYEQESLPIVVAGLVDFEIVEAFREEGIGSYLLTEVLNYLTQVGVSDVMMRISAENSAGLSLFEKLGFLCVDSGTVYTKQLLAES